MIALNNEFKTMLSSPVRKLGARVELYEGSTLITIYKYTDALKSFLIERVGEDGKFFGYGVCHRLNVKLRDMNREIDISTANTLEIEFGIDETYVYPYPKFYVTEVHRDENTNELSITAYDRLYMAAAHLINEIPDLHSGYTIREFTTKCASVLGLPVALIDDEVFDTMYVSGANFEGTETIREALNAIAEATQTIYYINYDYVLTFKRLDRDGEPVLTIGKDDYISLSSKTNKRLGAICHATELGDNVEASLPEAGSTQYVRNNPFWDLREDIDILVENALAAIGGITINQFDCSWRGNFALEVGDKIALVTKDNKIQYAYLLNDNVSYNGFLEEKTEWRYVDNEEATAASPSTLGEALKQTFARVDKVNKQIDIVASRTEENSDKISSIQLNTDNIIASVEKVEKDLNDTVTGVNDDIANLTKKVEASMSAEDIKIQIKSELENGVDKVTTSTGFTFNEDGLTVSKSGSEMRTQITEDGMKVFRDNTEVLTANNVGVDAVNLHATTYLIIGNNSRLEDFDGNRTGCFWIGG